MKMRLSVDFVLQELKKGGLIIHKFCEQIYPQDFKFIVVAFVREEQDQVFGYYINSRRRSKNWDLQLELQNYYFLDRISYLSCETETNICSLQEMTTYLLKNPWEIKGHLAPRDNGSMKLLASYRRLKWTRYR